MVARSAQRDPLIPRPNGPSTVTVTISDGPGGDALVELPGHAEPVADIDVESSVGLVATVDAAGIVRVWSDAGGELEAEIDTGGLEVSSLSLSTDGSRILLSAGPAIWDGDVRSQRFGRQLARFPSAVGEVDHLADGTVAVLTTAGQLAVIDPTTPSTTVAAVDCCLDGFATTLAVDEGLMAVFDQRSGESVGDHTIIDVETGQRTRIGWSTGAACPTTRSSG